jgi:hypothetical protein
VGKAATVLLHCVVGMFYVVMKHYYVVGEASVLVVQHYYAVVKLSHVFYYNSVVYFVVWVNHCGVGMFFVVDGEISLLFYYCFVGKTVVLLHHCVAEMLFDAVIQHYYVVEDIPLVFCESSVG